MEPTFMLRLHRLALVVAAVSVSTSAFAQAPKGGPPPSPTAAPAKAPDRADGLFEQGAAAYRAGRLQEAEEKLSQAWALKKTHDIGGDLGIVEFKLGKFAPAAEHLSWALQHFPPTESDQARRGFEEMLAKARPMIGVLRIRVNVDGAEVTVNGRSLGSAPVGEEVFVEPGTANVVARRDGYVTATQALPVAKGDAKEVSLSLQLAGKPERRSVVPGAVLGGVAGAALVTGIGLFVGGRLKLSTAQSEHDAIVNAGHDCVPGGAKLDTAGCSNLQSATSTSNTLQRAGVGLTIVAGATAAATLIYFVVPPSSSSAPNTGALRIAPMLSPVGSGLVVSATW